MLRRKRENDLYNIYLIQSSKYMYVFACIYKIFAATLSIYVCMEKKRNLYHVRKKKGRGEEGGNSSLCVYVSCNVSENERAGEWGKRKQGLLRGRKCGDEGYEEIALQEIVKRRKERERRYENIQYESIRL